jgi:hypothetical protein
MPQSIHLKMVKTVNILLGLFHYNLEIIKFTLRIVEKKEVVTWTTLWGHRMNHGLPIPYFFLIYG